MRVEDPSETASSVSKHALLFRTEWFVLEELLCSSMDPGVYPITGEIPRWRFSYRPTEATCGFSRCSLRQAHDDVPRIEDFWCADEPPRVSSTLTTNGRPT